MSAYYMTQVKKWKKGAKNLAQVTVELRHLLKTDFELFDFDYTVDDPQFKKEVEQAIIDTYFFHEINGTPDYFKHSFRTRFLSAISYYNKLYNTTLLEYNPLINYKMSEALEQLSNTTGEQTSVMNEDSNTNTTSTGTTEGEQIRSNTTTGNTTNNLKQQTNEDRKGSNYPQQQITAGNYLSDETLLDSEVTNTGTVNTTGSDNGTTNDTTTANDNSNQTNERTQTSNQDTTQNTNMSYEKTVEGLTGTSYQELISKERANILRIVGMVVAEMKPCFILVYQ